jgi:hypothetical protein
MMGRILNMTIITGLNPLDSVNSLITPASCKKNNKEGFSAN